MLDFRAGERGEHITSAADMARLFFLLAEGRAVDARVSEEALRTLELRQAHTWLAESLPWWVKVAHKWGDLPDARNDVGRGVHPARQLRGGRPRHRTPHQTRPSAPSPVSRRPSMTSCANSLGALPIDLLPSSQQQPMLPDEQRVIGLQRPELVVQQMVRLLQQQVVPFQRRASVTLGADFSFEALEA